MRMIPDALPSPGLLPGVVQVSHDGLPVVLMNDARTTGGYPRMTRVVEADCCHLAPVRPGESIHLCDLGQALQGHSTR